MTHKERIEVLAVIFENALSPAQLEILCDVASIPFQESEPSSVAAERIAARVLFQIWEPKC